MSISIRFIIYVLNLKKTTQLYDDCKREDYQANVYEKKFRF